LPCQSIEGKGQKEKVKTAFGIVIKELSQSSKETKVLGKNANNPASIGSSATPAKRESKLPLRLSATGPLR
jgi:hypothetical protein